MAYHFVQEGDNVIYVDAKGHGTRAVYLGCGKSGIQYADLQIGNETVKDVLFALWCDNATTPRWRREAHFERPRKEQI